MRTRTTVFRAALVLATAAGLGACATAPQDGKSAETVKATAPPGAPAAAGAAKGNAATAPAAAASGAAARPVPPAAAATPSGPPPFAAVIKDARRIDGPLTLWQKEDKVWIELTPAQLGKPYLLSPKIKSGISEAFVLGGLMAYPVNGSGGPQVVEFQRVHNQVRLQALNTDIMAKAGTPEARAVADTYSNSLLGSTPVASQPHPDRKSVLIEANSLFLSDMLGIGMMLQRSLRQGYGLDRGNSLITAVRGSDEAMVIETQNHFFTGSISTPTPGAPPGAPLPSIPRFLPDARSMLIGLHFSIAPLPDVPMATRAADPRIGMFSTAVLDFSSDLSASPRKRFVNRWRLEKKDPAAALSPPVKPITYWIDRNVPLAYRESVRAAILEWNKAFEKIGIQGAIVVEQQADDAKFDTLDFGYASVRWMMNASPTFAAIGPAHFDPRTGEILDADIAFEGMAARSIRTLRSQVLPGSPSSPGAAAAPLSFATPFELPGGTGAGIDHRLCMHGALAAEQLGYALDVLEAQGQLEPDSPIAQQFVQDYVKEAVMHEVGHTLGLRHNFRASRAYTEAQLADAEFTRAHGTTGSVMEYNAVNLPRPGQSGGLPFHTALGPYDYWAIEYAYKPMAAGTKPQDEAGRTAAHCRTQQRAFAGLRHRRRRRLWHRPRNHSDGPGRRPAGLCRQAPGHRTRPVQAPGVACAVATTQNYAVLRRSIDYALSDVTRAVGVLVRQIGGVRTLRDFPGSGREPLLPVAAPVQRQALDLLASAVLSADGLSLSPALQRRLAPDYLDRAEGCGHWHRLLAGAAPAGPAARRARPT
jgi:hypothetical protein